MQRVKHLIKIKYPIVVEGKYDKITLTNIVDALIIKTDGFSIFKDTEKCRMIRTLAEKTGGIVVLTDSDNAGNMIRAHLKNIISDAAEIINVYVPVIKGKEKRKTAPSKEGILGVEGMDKDILLDAFQKSGLIYEKVLEHKKITKTDMFLYGLSGGSNSRENRKSFLKFINLPENLSSNALLDIVNTYFTYTEFVEVVKKWQNSKDKN